ncbi:uncharacterized protein LOC135848958 [Planococcus citri]|uniref:uncharacterized protein LOC135848958 n=1 Tax=Planococcus citri TaxID=170843 RepID=UPI0031F72898
MSDYDERVDVKESEDEYEYFRTREYYGDECAKCMTDDAYTFGRLTPVILTNVPKLQEMASVVVAASLWNHINIPKAVSGVRDRCLKGSTTWFIVRGRAIDGYSAWSTMRGKVIGLIQELPVSKPITEQIDRCVRRMANEITAWVSYHYNAVFLANGIDKFVYNLLYRIVWNCNGTINCVKTARNMKTSLRLSEIEKFRFFATYCLEDEMSTMSQLLYSDNALDCLPFLEYPLIFYWCCYFEDELDKIRATKGYNKNLSIDVYMFQNREVDNWPAKEYFFDRLSSEEQVQQAIWLIDSKHGAIYQKAVLLKLDENQRMRVYVERAAQIIVNYARPRISSRFILQTWSEARHLFSPDQFLNLFQDLLIKTDVKDVLLTEIWSSASDNFKRHVVCANEHEIVETVLTKWKWRKDSDFVFVLLQDSNAKIKKSIASKKFFYTYCEKLTVNCKFQQLGRLLELCLLDAQELAQLKMKIVNNLDRENFNIHCEKLLLNSEFDKLDRLLEFCISGADNLAKFKIELVSNSIHVRQICLKYYSSGNTKALNKYLQQLLASHPDVVLEYKKNLISSTDGFSLCVSIMDSPVDVLNVILKDSLKTAKTIKEFKKSMILSPEAISKLKDLLLNNRLNSVQICIDRYLTTIQDKNALKKQLIDDFNVQLMLSILRNNDESYLQSASIWWFGNENAVQEFKGTLNLDSIFIDMLKNCVFQRYDRYLSGCVFKSCEPSDFEVMERFLNWYFQSSTKVKEYKMKVIYSYSKIDMFQTLLRGNSGQSQLRMVLNWFFKNDTAEISKFKKQGGKITYLI